MEPVIEDLEPVMTYPERILVELFTALPDVDTALIRHYGVLAMITGILTTSQDVIDARLMWDIYDHQHDELMVAHANAIQGVVRKLND